MPRSRALLSLIPLVAALPVAAQLAPGGASVKLPSQPQALERYGSSIALADHDADGHLDLAVGRPGNSSQASGAGAVLVAFGDGTGRWPIGFNLIEVSEGGRAGTRVVAANVDGDLGVEFVASIPGDERLRVYDDDDPDYSVRLSQIVPGPPNSNGSFGEALAVGDFDGDGYDDLAIGAPDANAQGGIGNVVAAAGAVWVVYGSASGLDVDSAQYWSCYQLLCTAAEGEEFGFAVAAGDFDGDGFDDLAIGDPAHDVGEYPDSGEINVLPGGSSGLSATGATRFIADDFWGLASFADYRFGAWLETARLLPTPAADGYDDLVIGLPGRPEFTNSEAGAVVAVSGSPVGLDGDESGETVHFYDIDLHPTIPPCGDCGQAFDRFGTSFAVGDLNADGQDDLAIHAPGFDFGATTETGVLGVYISGFGPGDGYSNAFQLLSGSFAAASAPARSDDAFGATAAFGDVDEDGHTDLVVGVPGRDVGGQNQAGAIVVLFGAIFADDFELGSTASWPLWTRN